MHKATKNEPFPICYLLPVSCQNSKTLTFICLMTICNKMFFFHSLLEKGLGWTDQEVQPPVSIFCFAETTQAGRPVPANTFQSLITSAPLPACFLLPPSFNKAACLELRLAEKPVLRQPSHLDSSHFPSQGNNGVCQGQLPGWEYLANKRHSQCSQRFTLLGLHVPTAISHRQSNFIAILYSQPSLRILGWWGGGGVEACP